jgi:hypothetical protein
VSDAEVEAARRELTDAKADFDLRLRSLRQEHEKIKAQYEKRIEALETAAASSSTPVKAAAGSAGSSRGSTPGSGDKAEKGASPKTLAGALVRVRELESEVERIRTFYTKKVDEEKRKAEAQISALKRGTAAAAASDGRTGDALSYGVDSAQVAPSPTGQDAPATATGKPEVSVADQIQNALAELRAEYDVRLSLANAQVSAAQREAQEARLHPAASGSAPAQLAAPTVADIRSCAAFSEEVAREVSARLAGAPLASSAAMHANELQHAVRLAEQKGSMEAEALRMRVREEEHKAQLLQREVDMLRTQVGNASASAGASPSPAGPQFAPQALLALETQITHLELRLARREGELMSALEQGRSASKIERARLEAIHASELREKDEQLVKFQTGLEQLVYALRQWQAVAYEAQQQSAGLPPPPRVAAFGLSV